MFNECLVTRIERVGERIAALHQAFRQAQTQSVELRKQIDAAGRDTAEAAHIYAQSTTDTLGKRTQGYFQ